MKLFGGGGGHNGAPRREQNKQTMAPRAPVPQAARAPQAGRTAPRPAGGRPAAPGKSGKAAKLPKPQATRQQKRRRIILIAVLAVLAVIAIVFGVLAWIYVRPPEFKNDPTINDPENGDKVDVNGLLNSGQRVDDVFTFVVGAVDEDETRTDALMVATMDTRKKTINIMNIPRDTMCNNGYSEASRKINAAYGMKKGIEQTKIEIERLMGFQPDKYVIVNFDGIAAIVDAIGGVDYEVPFRMEYDDPGQDLHIDLYAGNQHLNGKQTVEFLRWRHNNDYSMQYPNGDEGRVENQQKFLKYLAGEVLQLKNVTKIKSIANAVFDNVKTDFTAGQILWMGMQALQIKNESIQFFTLPGYGQMSTAGTSLPLSFFFPYYQQTLDLVNQYFNPYSQPITTLDMVDGPESGGYYGGESDPDVYVWGDSNSGGDNGDTPGETGEPGGGDDPEAPSGTGTGDPDNPEDPGVSPGGEDPGTSDPGSDPGGSDPGGSDPGSSDPGPGDSGGGEPAPADPAAPPELPSGIDVPTGDPEG